MPELDGMLQPVWPKTEMTHESPDLNQLKDLDKMDKIDYAKSFRINRKEIVEPDKLTRDEYERLKETRLTVEEWDAIPKEKDGTSAA